MVSTFQRFGRHGFTATLPFSIRTYNSVRHFRPVPLINIGSRGGLNVFNRDRGYFFRGTFSFARKGGEQVFNYSTNGTVEIVETIIEIIRWIWSVGF